MKLWNLLLASFASSYFNVLCILMYSIIQLHFQWPIHFLLMCGSFLRQGRHKFFFQLFQQKQRKGVYNDGFCIQRCIRKLSEIRLKEELCDIQILCFIIFPPFLSCINFISLFPSPFLKIGKFILKDVCEHSLIFTAQAKSARHPNAEFLQSTDSIDQKSVLVKIGRNYKGPVRLRGLRLGVFL